MLMKSIKHDILATYRDFAALYLVLMVMAITAPLIFATRLEWLTALIIISLTFVSIGIMVVTFISIVRLYARRLYSNEGYLTLTLPVSTTETLISKAITGLFWSLVTFLVFVVAFLLFSLTFYLVFNNSQWDDVLAVFSIVNEIWQSGYIWEITKTLLLQAPLMLTSTLYSLTLLLFIVTLVHTSFIKKHRLPLGVLIYYVLGNLISVLMLMFMSSLFTVDSAMQDVALNLGGAYFLFNGTSFVIDWAYYGTQMALYLLIIGALGYGSWWLVEKKLEVE
jgi:hypothetical protein